MHSDEDVEATQDMKFVDPNSMAYQNAVLEHKINKQVKEAKSRKFN